MDTSPCRFVVGQIRMGIMIRAGLLSEENGHTVIALACEESAACGVTRRVNALVLLEDGQSCRERESTEDAELYRATRRSIP